MRKLWRDIRTHPRAAVFFLVYWLVTAVVVLTVLADSVPGAVLALSTALIAGTLVGWWRSSERIRGGTLAGALTGGLVSIELAVIEMVNWMRLGHNFQKDEVLGFSIFLVIVGALLGLAGAVLAMILDRFRRRGRPS